MAQEIKNVVLIGASGNLGPAILKGLLDTGAFNVTVLSRKESTATFPPQVKSIKTDYSDEHLAEVFAGQDAVISNINGAQMDVQRRTVEAAARAGVKRYLPSEFGGNTTTEEGQKACFLFGIKVKAVAHLQQKASENPNFSWSAVVTGPFFDWGLKNGFLGFDLKSRTATIWDSGDSTWATTNLASIGKAVANTLLKPAETKNRYIWVNSFSVSQNAVLAALEKATGAQWKTERVSLKQQREEGQANLSQGGFKPVAQLILSAIFDPTTGTDYAKTEKLDNELLGLPKEDLESTVAAVVKEVS